MEHVTGQAILGDEESTLTVLDMYTDKNPDVKDNSLGNVVLTHGTNL